MNRDSISPPQSLQLRNFSTSHAASLIEEGRCGEHFLCAPDAAGLAAALDRVLADALAAAAVAAAGRELAARSYSIETLASLLVDEGV